MEEVLVDFNYISKCIGKYPTLLSGSLQEKAVSREFAVWVVDEVELPL